MADKFPESIKINTALTTNATWSSVSIEVPLLNLPSAGKGARVIEILNIDYEPITIATTAMSVSIGGFDYGGVSTSIAPVAMVATDLRQFEFKFLPVTAAAYPQQNSDFVFANKGILYPNSIFTINTSSGATTNNQVLVTIWYRIKSVSLKEYLDLVQMYQVGGQTL